MSCSGKKNNKKYLRGGSPASDLVNKASLGPPVKDDFVTSPRVRDGPNADMLDKLYGGSGESDLVMKQLGDCATTNKYPLGYDVKASMNSINLYNPSGGSKKNKKKNKKNKTTNKLHNTKTNHGNKYRKYKKSSKTGNFKNSNNFKNSKYNNKNKKINMKGGSDWIASQYSLGSYNAPEMSAGDVGKFSNSLAGSREDYMNPSSLGSAGSGYPMGSLEGANVRMTGAPLV